MGRRKRQEGEIASVRWTISMSPEDAILFSRLAKIDGVSKSQILIEHARLGALIDLQGRNGDAVQAISGGPILSSEKGYIRPHSKYMLQMLDIVEEFRRDKIIGEEK